VRTRAHSTRVLVFYSTYSRTAGILVSGLWPLPHASASASVRARDRPIKRRGQHHTGKIHYSYGHGAVRLIGRRCERSPGEATQTINTAVRYSRTTASCRILIASSGSLVRPASHLLISTHAGAALGVRPCGHEAALRPLALCPDTLRRAELCRLLGHLALVPRPCGAVPSILSS
jgi:hypothetical protein